MELWQENQDLKRELELLRNKMLTVDGWKGKDDIEINREGNIWVIVEHRKDKDTWEIIEQKHTTAHRNVQLMWAIIKKACPTLDKKTKFRELHPYLLKVHNLPDISPESFQGGKNRSKYLFPLYYYPIKVLERLKYITYGGSGIIQRLK